jgi:hypothetical protein
MDIARTTRRTHSRSTSLTGSLFSLLSPSSYSPSVGRSKAPSLSSQSDASTAGVGLGLSVGAANPVEEGEEEEMSLPVFEVQPAMLAVDLALSPGESRTCECLASSRVTTLTPNRHIHPPPPLEPPSHLRGPHDPFLI